MGRLFLTSDEETVLGKEAVRSPLRILAISAAALVLLAQPNAMKGGERSPSMIDLVKNADLIVVARVVGIIDPKPAAQSRKHREAHWDPCAANAEAL